MQQRRLRLGDILDDYCPRERRITNHAVVAMIEDQVKQTRCTTCDADHEYKGAKVPASRRRKDALIAETEDASHAAGLIRPAVPEVETADSEVHSDETLSGEGTPAEPPPEQELSASAPADAQVPSETDDAGEAGVDEEGPVHRRLIRATLPRPEGQAPERKIPEFTVRQPGNRGRGPFDGNHNGGQGPQRHGRARRAMRGPNQQGQPSGGPHRFGGPRQGSLPGSRQDGNRSAPPGGQRGGGRPGQGPPRGPRPPGRKRGR